MGFFDRFKQEKAAPKEACQIPDPVRGPAPNTGVILLFDRPRIEIQEFRAAVCGQFGEEAILSVDKSSPSLTNLMLQIDQTDVMLSYIPFPLPEEEGNLPALMGVNRFLSQEEQQAVLGQKSFCLVTQIGGGATLEGKRAVCRMLTGLCAALLAVEGAAGVYYSAANLLLGKSIYLHYAAIAAQQAQNPDYFPVILWVLVYQTQAEGGAPTVETCGLEQFGFWELQFYRPTEEWAQSYEKLYMMATLQVIGREVYRNMDTISFTPDGLSVFKQSGNRLAVIGGI